MSNVSTIPAPVAAEASGAGSFFGSCQIAANNFKAALNNAVVQQNSKASAAPEKASATQSLSLTEQLTDPNESEVLLQLQAILGDDAGAEAFKRITDLLENGSLSVQNNLDDINVADFEDMTKSLLERLDLALKQIIVLSQENAKDGEIDAANLFANLSANEDKLTNGEGENANDFLQFTNNYNDREAFLNTLRDLLKIGVITPKEFETALKDPENSNIPDLILDLKGEARNLLTALGNAKDAKNAENPNALNTVKNSQIPPELMLQAESKGSNIEKITSIDEILKPIEKTVLKFLENATDTPSLKAEQLLGKEEFQDKNVGSPNQLKSFDKTSAATQQDSQPLFSASQNAGKSEENKTAEPEVRAAWEGGELKIETFNPKTGEKLSSVSASSTPSYANMQERINEFEVVKQVVAQARFITTPTGEQKITMQLNPDHLGQMDLRVVLNNGEMQIHARVESATAQHALESQIGLLREGLEKQGITLDRLEVSVEQREKSDYALTEEQNQQQRKDRQGRNKRGNSIHLAVSISGNENSDTGRRLGYNTMEYLA
ncbi:hypothetical protein AGMMS49938_09810 [Fibrobacterales bacterium]|nr:hypothetical protein AGMMS49938_09810 [Fibrobacterales bacterium]